MPRNLKSGLNLHGKQLSVLIGNDHYLVNLVAPGLHVVSRNFRSGPNRFVASGLYVGKFAAFLRFDPRTVAINVEKEHCHES